MGKKKEKRGKVRAEPKNMLMINSPDAFQILCGDGYIRLSECPEIMAAVGKIADLASSMTIHLMGNTDRGDVRIRNQLSKMVDITPNKRMTRKTFISVIIRTLLLEGDGNAVVLPETRGGLIENLTPIAPAQVSFIGDMYDYLIYVSGKMVEPDDVLHFVINPDPNMPWKGTGYRVSLREVAKTLKQAAKTKNEFMESKWMPSVIIKADANVEEFSTKEGRERIVEKYINTTSAGEPWVIPTEMFDVTSVKPLSLNDIAISDSVKMDKRTVASILGVPAFVVGEGSFNEGEWNNFINTKIRPLCNAVEQELTKKLLISPDWYFRFNIRSLYTYDIEKLSRVGDDNYTRGIMTGNEVRDWLGMSPMDGLDELVVLENYIPRGMIGDQSKLQGGE